MDKLIKIYHKDWNGECIIRNKENNTIQRLDVTDENGTFIYNENDLIIKWEKWSSDYCINIYNNLYVEKKYYETLDINYLMSTNKNYILLFNEKNQIINQNQNQNQDQEQNQEQNQTNNIIYKNKKYINFIDNIYVNEEEINNFFNLDTINFNKKSTYILNKINNKFYNKTNFNNNGIYTINNNILTLKWSNNIEKKFISNIYYESKQELNYENIKIIKPQNFNIQEKVLFTNITFIKNKIYLVSINYKNKEWIYDSIQFHIRNQIQNQSLDCPNQTLIINKKIIHYNNYENCTLIILELSKEKQTVNLQINYNSHQKDFQLNQLILPKEEIYAMTLFKDDYMLLKKYLEYYSNLGISCFYLYYNGKITENFINEINIINQSKYKIIITEWNYDYWYYLDEMKKEKHHHAQVNAINDALCILKHFSSYILYNDLDEYIKLEHPYHNFQDLINQNQTIDIFEFKCLFCKMGESLIKYRNFYFEYDETNIIKGNFWTKYREKNLIKSSQIDFMGVHEPVYLHCKENLNKKYISYFYHIINFYEKNRNELMTQYIS